MRGLGYGYAACCCGLGDYELGGGGGGGCLVGHCGGREEGREWKETAMGKENNRADGELVVNHVIRRKEALIR